MCNSTYASVTSRRRSRTSSTHPSRILPGQVRSFVAIFFSENVYSCISLPRSDVFEPAYVLCSIDQSLSLLKKLQDALHRENLQADLDEKYLLIFHNYGLDLSQVQDIYEKYKHNPPMPRNTPPVTGNILWSRHLLRRIQGENEARHVYIFISIFVCKYTIFLHAIDLVYTILH